MRVSYKLIALSPEEEPIDPRDCRFCKGTGKNGIKTCPSCLGSTKENAVSYFKWVPEPIVVDSLWRDCA